VLFKGFPGVRQVKGLMLSQYEIGVGVKPRIINIVRKLIFVSTPDHQGCMFARLLNVTVDIPLELPKE